MEMRGERVCGRVGTCRSSTTPDSVSLRVLSSSAVEFLPRSSKLSMNYIVIVLCAATAVGRVYTDRIHFPIETDVENPNAAPTTPPAAMPTTPLGTDLTLRQPLYPPPAASASAAAPQAASSFSPPALQKPYSPGLLDRGVNALTLNVETLLDDGRNNLVFSPLSIAGALSLILLGSAGQTLTEIAHFLGIKAGVNYAADGTDLIHQEIAEYFRRFQALRVGGSLRFASGVFIQEDLKVSAIYEKNVKNLYQTEVNHINFLQSPIESMDRINKWVSNRTEGSIDQLVAAPLPAQTTAVFVNVIYFDGEWQHLFPSDSTRQGNFYVSPTETVQVQLMPNVAEAYFYQEKPSAQGAKGLKILGLPYKNSDLAMYFILAPQGPKAFLAGVTVDRLMDMIDNTTLQECVYVVPKMKLESTLLLSEPLKEMGLKNMFTPSADLKAIAEGIWVDQVLQKVRVEVTETGTKAVAATMVSSVRSGKPTVRLDRPFIFMIYSRSLRAISFWGTVYRPEPFKTLKPALRRHRRTVS
uniref:Neuroserpin n=1 Tax=Lygus hesperus TaxID=30085 RepID=A0A146L9W5_LYGHE